MNPLVKWSLERDLALIDYLKIGASLLWTGDIEGRKIRCTTPIPVTEDLSEQQYARYTMYGFTISYSKRNNMFFALIGMEMKLDEPTILAGSLGFNVFAEGHRLGFAAIASIDAGVSLYYDNSLAYVMTMEGLAMHDTGEPEDKEWPSYEVTRRGFTRAANVLLKSLLQ